MDVKPTQTADTTVPPTNPSPSANEAGPLSTNLTSAPQTPPEPKTQIFLDADEQRTDQRNSRKITMIAVAYVVLGGIGAAMASLQILSLGGELGARLGGLNFAIATAAVIAGFSLLRKNKTRLALARIATTISLLLQMIWIIFFWPFFMLAIPWLFYAQDMFISVSTFSLIMLLNIWTPLQLSRKNVKRLFLSTNE